MEVLEKLNVLESVKINLPKVQVVVLDIKTTKILQQKMLHNFYVVEILVALSGMI